MYASTKMLQINLIHTSTISKSGTVHEQFVFN